MVLAVLDTHPPFHPWGVAAGCDALLGEPANSKKVAVPFISISRFSSCDRQLPGEQNFFSLAIVSLQRWRIVM